MSVNIERDARKLLEFIGEGQDEVWLRAATKHLRGVKRRVEGLRPDLVTSLECPTTGIAAYTDVRAPGTALVVRTPLRATSAGTLVP